MSKWYKKKHKKLPRIPCRQWRAEVAQLVEQPIRNRQVPGSSPGLGSILSLINASVSGPGTSETKSSRGAREVDS